MKNLENKALKLKPSSFSVFVAVIISFVIIPRNYFNILYNKETKEIKMDVAENHSVVMLPMSEF